MLKVKFDLKEVEFNLQFNLDCTEYEIYNYPEFGYCVYFDLCIKLCYFYFGRNNTILSVSFAN